MISSISTRTAASIFKAGRSRQITVIGDVMLDQFIWGKVSRISPEAPVPVVEVDRETFHLGGAANVAHNLQRLGSTPLLIGVQGEDDAARRLHDVLESTGISEASLISDASRPTTVKTRTIAHSQQMVRTDWESRQELTDEVEAKVLEKVEEALKQSRGLVLSDYSKGTLTPRVLGRSIQLARRRRIPVLVDPKLKRFSAYRRVTLVTPNVPEAQAATGTMIEGPSELTQAAKKILNLLHCDAALVTRGEQGMSLFEKSKRPVHICASAREVFDVTGAGDTVIATAAFVLAAGGSLKQAAVLANQAAGIVVGKLGTATTTPEEILQSLESGSRA
jgi:D-beta-D-heptose 7-phosphate kinase/D-beta-D-heptose 1-phosphate adenosyltransferase